MLEAFWTPGGSLMPIDIESLITVRLALGCMCLKEHEDFGGADDLPGTTIILYDRRQTLKLLEVDTDREITDRDS